MQQKEKCAQCKDKNSYKRIRNIYDPTSSKHFKISRSKLDLFLKCPRCFYIDRRLGVGLPDGYPFSLNIAVDELLKKEFDVYRLEQKPHPLFIENNIEAIPFKHDNIDRWRNSLHEGIQYEVPGTNLKLTGGVDDVWINTKTKELIVVDYKATSKTGSVGIDADWQKGYKRQVEIYQWLFRKNGFAVSNTAYFVYCNGKKDVDGFNKQLLFDISLIGYEGTDSWVDAAIMHAYQLLQSDIVPPSGDDCDFCKYFLSRSKELQ